MPIRSNFTCAGRQTGYYADVPSNCRIYHNCDDQGNKFSYYCPEMTAFRQEALVCDHAHLVDCEAGIKFAQTTSEAPRIVQSTTKQFLNGTNSKLSGNPLSGFRFGSSVAATNNSSQVSAFNFKESSNFRKEFSASGKSSGDQPSTNSRGDTAWFKHLGNGGTELGTHPEVNRNAKERPGPTTSTAKPYFNFQNSNYPRLYKGETNSGQIPVPASPKTTTTTTTTTTRTTIQEIPYRDFTASLKPLVPNELEYDPYYPRESWTTETYHKTSKTDKLPPAVVAPNFEPSIVGVYFKIPDVWPDFNTLDDIVDRRKLFYIPR